MSLPMTPPSPPTKARSIGKKIALVCAGGSLTCGFFALGLALWFWMSHGVAHVYTASLFATTFFFVSAAAVLYGMSQPQALLPPEKTG